MTIHVRLSNLITRIFWFSVSGLSGSKETAQSQVSVGMGLLAGSTVMLLTVIWGTCIVVGKCDLENGVAVDSTDTKRFNLTGLPFIFSSISPILCWSSWTCYSMLTHCLHLTNHVSLFWIVWFLLLYVLVFGGNCIFSVTEHDDLQLWSHTLK